MLLIARPVSDPPRRFRFGSFADLTAALSCCPDGIDSDVVYIAGGWELFTHAEDTLLPNAVFEFGEALPCTVALYAHIRSPGATPPKRFGVISADFALFICRRMW